MEMTHTGKRKGNNEIDRDGLIKVLEETNVSAFLNGWGPINVIQVYDPDFNMQGILVLDNTALGPACGGIRISPIITPHQVFLNARKMTLSCALVNVKFGGAAAGIRANPFDVDKIKLIKSFARGVSPYVPDQYDLEFPNSERIGHGAETKSSLKYFNNRKASIYGGSNEIQKNVVSKHVLGL